VPSANEFMQVKKRNYAFNSRYKGLLQSFNTIPVRVDNFNNLSKSLTYDEAFETRGCLGLLLEGLQSPDEAFDCLILSSGPI